MARRLGKTRKRPALGPGLKRRVKSGRLSVAKARRTQTTRRRVRRGKTATTRRRKRYS